MALPTRLAEFTAGALAFGVAFVVAITSLGVQNPSTLLASVDWSSSSWSSVPNEYGGWTQISMSDDGLIQVAVGDGYIYVSTNGAKSFGKRGEAVDWYDVAVSADGTKMVAVTYGSSEPVWISNDSGDTWNSAAGITAEGIVTVGMSEDGMTIFVAGYNDGLWRSLDGGETWENIWPHVYAIQSVAVSNDGTKVTLTSERVYRSTDGLAVTPTFGIVGPPSVSYYQIAMSGDGAKQIFGVPGGHLWVSTDTGATWQEVMTDQNRDWQGVEVSDDGSVLAAVDHGSYIYASDDSGQTWTAQTSTGIKDWFDIAMNSSMTMLSATADYIWTYGPTGGRDDCLLLATPYEGAGFSAPQFTVTIPGTIDDYFTGSFNLPAGTYPLTRNGVEGSATWGLTYSSSPGALLTLIGPSSVESPTATWVFRVGDVPQEVGYFEFADTDSLTCPHKFYTADGYADAIITVERVAECAVAADCGTPPANSCFTYSCNGQGVCQMDNASSGTSCRVSAGVCDAAETCTGSSTSCPADSFSNSSTSCRAATDLCDAVEYCTGSAASCPADGNASSGTVCRASAGTCDTAEACTGSSAACPSDSFLASDQECRAAVSVCDVAENCTGSAAACPADSFATSSVQCRAAAGVCDVVENCTGSSTTCPADSVSSAGGTCRSASGTCDVAETCDGVTTGCPADGYVSSGSPCRGSGGDCDVVEVCLGYSANCPADGYQSSGECHSYVNECDPAVSCNGLVNSCPVDNSVYNGNSCDGGTGTCQSGTCVPNGATCGNTIIESGEQCDGGACCNGSCQYASSGTSCRASAGTCDIAETCTGSSASCPADVVQSASYECRASAGTCDTAETCTGSSTSCPSDTFQNSSTVCRASAGSCDVAENCPGDSVSCPSDTLLTSSTICRVASGACDVAETCDGSQAGCPTDTYSTSQCHASTGECDEPASCSGSQNTCPYLPAFRDGQSCSSGAGICQSGSCVLYCGDGDWDTGESCDSSDLHSETCTSLGYIGGTLSCRANCTFDVDLCTSSCPSGQIRGANGTCSPPLKSGTNGAPPTSAPYVPPALIPTPIIVPPSSVPPTVVPPVVVPPVVVPDQVVVENPPEEELLCVCKNVIRGADDPLPFDTDRVTIDDCNAEVAGIPHNTVFDCSLDQQAGVEETLFEIYDTATNTLVPINSNLIDSQSEFTSVMQRLGIDPTYVFILPEDAN